MHAVTNRPGPHRSTDNGRKATLTHPPDPVRVRMHVEVLQEVRVLPDDRHGPKVLNDRACRPDGAEMVGNKQKQEASEEGGSGSTVAYRQNPACLSRIVANMGVPGN